LNNKSVAMKITIPRTMNEIRNHPLVESISDERGNDDGIWIYLISGYISDLECGIIHEHTVKECCNAFHGIHKNGYIRK